MKKCPYCAEEIQEDAIKCKHCMEFLDGSNRSIPPALPPIRPQELPWYLRTSFIVLMFLTMPPFALPSVWLHPKMHVIMKLLITVAAIASCWISYYAITNLLRQYDELFKMMQQMPL